MKVNLLLIAITMASAICAYREISRPDAIGTCFQMRKDRARIKLREKTMLGYIAENITPGKSLSEPAFFYIPRGDLEYFYAKVPCPQK